MICGVISKGNIGINYCHTHKQRAHLCQMCRYCQHHISLCMLWPRYCKHCSCQADTFAGPAGMGDKGQISARYHYH